MRRKGWVLLLAVAVLVPGGLLCVEHFRGAHQLRAALAELTSRGETLDFQALLPAPVPAASNGLEILTSAMARLKRPGSLPAPPAYVFVPSGNAIPLTALSSWSSSPDDPATNTWDDLEAWLAANEDALSRVHEAAAFPTRAQELSARESWLLGVAALGPSRRAVLALTLSAMESSRRGDLDGVLADLEAARAIESDLGAYPLAFCQSLRATIVTIMNARIWAIVQARAWTEPELARIQTQLPSGDLLAGVVRGLVGSRAQGFHELHAREGTNALARGGWQDLFGPGNGGAPPLPVPNTLTSAANLAERLGTGAIQNFLARVLFPTWRFAWGDQAIVVYLRRMEELIREARDLAEGNLASTSPRTVSPENHSGSWLTRIRSLYAGFLVPGRDGTVNRALRSLTERSLLEAEIALRRHRLRHGQYPESLAALVPEFLRAVPRDGFGGGPIRYRREAEDHFRLWSVGTDRVDDGGEVSAPDESSPSIRRQLWSSRDAVWLQPATEEERAQWQRNEAANAVTRELRRDKGEKRGTDTFQPSPDLLRRYGLTAPTPAAAPAGRLGDRASTNSPVPAPTK